MNKKYTQDLIKAARTGDLKRLKDAYKKGGDIRACGDLALIHSIEHDYKDCEEFCRLAGSKLEYYDDLSEIEKAAILCNLTKMKIAAKEKKYKKKEWNKALLLTAPAGFLEGLMFCLENGASIYAENVFKENVWIISAANGQLEYLKFCYKTGGNYLAKNDKALIAASRGGHLECVKLCQENGGDEQFCLSKS